jgi:PKD repeat protein
MSTITVIPKPIPLFDGPSVICDQDSAITLVDRSYIPQGIGSISEWSWNVDGVQHAFQYLPPVKASHGGSLPVSLSVVTAEGCKSDTLRKELPVRHMPVAAFDYKNALCENEMVKFNDLSTIPSAVSDEHLEGWNWVFDDARGSAKQHPLEQFAAGVHTARLVAISNFGCTSELHG